MLRPREIGQTRFTIIVRGTTCPQRSWKTGLTRNMCAKLNARRGLRAFE